MATTPDKKAKGRMATEAALRPLGSFPPAPLQLGAVLRCAAALAAQLAQLHRQDMVHGSIDARCVFIDPDAGAAAIAPPARSREGGGYGGAMPLPEYISPEQTGRMNRPVDNRSDLYSFGLVLYRMLTGLSPFPSGDLLDWVYNHIARLPVPPREVRPEVPAVISALVLRLLAKNPEDRYQTAAGVQLDLERALARWEEEGMVANFPLGAQDLPERLTLPSRLYGRERDLAALVAAFGKAAHSGKGAMVMVVGFSGIGKSSLVRELYPTVARQRGYFASGKFDQYQRGIPYSPLVSALRDLVRQVLTEPEERIGQWRERIAQALGGSGQVVVDLVPELELVVGAQPPVPKLSAGEAQSRFILLFRRFIGAFAGREHPLVLFLDDLQWGDAASLKLIEEVATHRESDFLLIIGAYRENEVSPAHPLMVALNDMRRRGASIGTVTLSPLFLDDVEALLADTVHARAPQIGPLARLVIEKTGGNPLFVRQFLGMLYQEGLLFFDRESRQWRWDLTAIRAKGYTDNVAQLMAKRIERLPAESRQALPTAACLGESFGVHTLALVQGADAKAVLRALTPAERAGVLLRLDGEYKFLHDRVREAAIALLPEEERGAVHLAIARALAAGGVSDDALFDVASHFNEGAPLISEWEERRMVAALDLKAGEKAKSASAYQQACSFLASGARLLGGEGWERERQLAFDLHLERGECEYLRGGYREAGELLDLVQERAQARVELAEVYRVRILLCTVTGETERAVQATLDCLALFGLHLERHPPPEIVTEGYDKVLHALGGRSVEELVFLPPMSDRETCALSEALMAASPPVTNYDDRLHFAIIAETVRLSIEYGSAPCSLAAYVHFGSVIGPLLGEYRNGYRFGKLAYDLMERDRLTAYQARICAMFAYGIIPWTQHVGSALEYLREGVRAGSETGDVIFACYISACLVSIRLAMGDPLSEIEAELGERLEFVQSVGYADVEDALLLQRRLIHRLRGVTPLPRGREEDDLDQRILQRFPTVVYWYHVYALREAYLFGRYQDALAAAAKATELLWTATHLWESCEHSYYLGLTAAALCPATPSPERERHLSVLKEEAERNRRWGENAPQNFANRHALLAAEIARLEGRDPEAMALYERAVTSAHDNGFEPNEALANEAAASFYAQRGVTGAAHGYLRQARACYLRWKAEGKVRQLDRRHPWLKEEAPLQQRGEKGALAEVDALTVIKASQAIAGEIELGRLLDTLMRIVLENSGARKGYLLVAAGEELMPVACAQLVGERITVEDPAHAPVAELVPQSVVNLVRRTRERVILEDPMERTPFAADPYLARRRPLSALCLPVLRTGELVAVLYLENDLVRGAITAERVGVLEVLVAQAALSLENARVYEALREAEAKYRSIFENAVEGIYQATPSGRFLDANPALARMLGYDSPAQLIARITDIGQQLYVNPGERAELVRLVEEKDVVQFETRWYHKDGRVIWVLINGRCVRDNDGKALFYEGIVDDITERKAAEEELHSYRQHLEELVRERTSQLEHANIRLQELDRLKSLFIASMSHELRTPLNSIIGFTGMTLEGLSGPLTEEQEDNLSRAYHAAQHLLELITDIIDISKIESGRIDVFPEPITLGEVVDEAVLTVETQARQKGLLLEVQVAAGLRLFTDRKRLLQCLINLLGNAVKFTERGGISLSSRESGGFLEIAVADTGIGISADDLSRLFEPFERLETRLRVKAGGSGLGLYLTRKLAHDVLHGTVSVRSREGEGSVFTLRIPVVLHPVTELSREAQA